MSGQNRCEDERGGISREALEATDRYLDNIAVGLVPQSDELGQLLHVAKVSANKDIPAPPNLEALGFFSDDTHESSELHELRWDEPKYADRTSMQVAPASPAGDDEDVIHLSKWRARREKAHKHHMPAWVHAVGGAAAACVLIAGAGTVVHASKPGDPLWGMNVAIFGDHAAAVELTSTLDEASEKQRNGDTAGALSLLEKARALAEQQQTGNSHSDVTTLKKTETVTVTPEAPATETEPGQAPSTVTDTVTVTSVVTATESSTASPQPNPQSPGAEASQTSVTTTPAGPTPAS